MYSARIEIDGNDGTGKSTLVRFLQDLGFFNVSDRGRMTLATDDEKVTPEDGVIYIHLTAPVEVCRQRLQETGKNLEEKYHTVEDLQYYEKKFREVSRKFNAFTLDTHFQSRGAARVNALMRILSGTNHADQRLFIAPSSKLHRQENNRMAEIQDLARGHLYKTRAIPRLVAEGAYLCGVTTEDSLEEADLGPRGSLAARYTLKEFPKIRLSLIAHGESVLSGRGTVRVATEFPRTCKLIQQEGGLPKNFSFFRTYGKTENYINVGLAQAVVDIVDTGRTLKTCGLKEISILRHSQPVFISNEQNHPFVKAILSWFEEPFNV